ncbi:MAG TPA: membrane dipeptidase [Firmicutes bacterium]|nr:membrane dipeptidase [Candidatus Fermentithermobacillaceae bacterium]
MKKTDREELKSKAADLLKEAFIIDGHASSLFDAVNGLRDLRKKEETGHLDIPRLKEAGVSCQVLAAFPDQRIRPMRACRRGLIYSDAFHSLAEEPGVRIILSYADLEAIKETKELGIMFALEGGEFLEGEIAVLHMFYKLGARVIGLTWDERNELGDGVAEAMTKGGLTRFGFQVLKEAQSMGMLVDVSHLSEAGFWDVVESASLPVVASHSNCHKLYAHPRNLKDEEMEALRDIGGLIGISFNPSYLAGGGEITVSTVADHIEHALEVMGENGVGLGSDFDSFSGPGPIPSVEHLPVLVEELLKRGLKDEVLKKVLGLNYLRVFRAVMG